MNSYLCLTLLLGVVAYVSANCGNSYAQGGRVIAGQNARQGAWPWQILLKENGRAGCGGSLISSNWVVTAAHCIKPSRYSVVLGEQDLRYRSGAEQEISVSQVIVHPGWNSRTFDYDIALLRLSRPAQLNRNVSPVCLPNAHARTGASCYITGWGATRSFSPMHPTLQQAPMRVIDPNTCNRKNYYNIGIRITDRMICGGGQGRISGCQGDSGGPFVCSNNGRWELHGAVSHGSKDCNSSKSYTVYARVALFRQWIRQNTGV